MPLIDASMLAATARVIVAYAVVFVVLPRFTLPGLVPADRGRTLGDAVLVTAAVMVAGLAFSLLGMADSFTFVVALALGFGVSGWFRYRHTWQRTLLLSYGRFLVWLEALVPPQAAVPSAPPVPAAGMWASHRPTPIPSPVVRRVAPGRVEAGALVGVLAVAGVLLRLYPTLRAPAPYTVAFYANLEGVKGLLLGQPVRVGGDWGLHALTLALSSLSQVDPFYTLRAMGALSVGALAIAVYNAVRTYDGGRTAALVGAAAVAFAGALLPIPLDRQVEADGLTLAAALAVAAVPSALAYLTSRRRRDLAVAVAAVVACGLTHGLAGAVLAVGLGALLLARLVRGDARWRTGAVALALVATLAALAVGYRALVAAAPTGMVPFADLGGLGRPLLPIALCLVAGAALAARGVWARRAGDVAAGLASGLAGLAMALASGGAHGAQGAAAVLGTGAVAVAVALLAAPLVRRFDERVRSPRAVLAAAVVVGVVSAGLAQVPGVAPGASRGVEPSGFVRAYDAVEREAFPLTYTIVGSTAQRIRALGRGRFMDYEYFLDRYDPATYRHTARGAIPTEDLFIFLEREPSTLRTVDELSPGGGRWAMAAAGWVARYRRRADSPPPMTVFFEDDEVVVYRITREAPSLLEQVHALPPP